MILLVIFGLLALFSLISIVLDTDEPRQGDAGRRVDDVSYLMRWVAR